MRPQSHLKATPKPGESSDVSTAPFGPYSVSGKTRCSGVLACGLGHRTALTRRSKSYTWGSHPPDTVRSPTVPPSYPHATGWLAGKKILNTENSADEGRPRLRTDARSRVLASSIAPKTAANRNGSVMAEEGFGGVRPSSGAASTEHTDVLGFITSPSQLNMNVQAHR